MNLKRFMNKKVVAIGLAAGITLGGAGAAFAYWTTTGSGGGSSTLASSNGTVTLHASFTSGALTPGGSVPVTITADNSGTTNLFVTSVVDGATPIAVSDGCNLPDFSLQASPTLANAAGTEIPANTTGTVVATDTLTYANTDVDQSACKGGTVTLSYTSS
jgi:hypothetical protein